MKLSKITAIYLVCDYVCLQCWSGSTRQFFLSTSDFTLVLVASCWIFGLVVATKFGMLHFTEKPS